MNESLSRHFCESPHRKLIVAILTTLIGLVVLLPLVDDYFGNKRSRRTLTDELNNARQTVEILPTFEKRVLQLDEEVGQLESRSVSGDTVSQFRSKLVDLIRDSGCQVRRLDVGAPTLRPWLENDDPLKKMVAIGKGPKKTPFTLERRSVVIVAGGSMANVHGLLEQLQKDAAFAYPRRVKIHSASRQGESVALELELWVFALARQPT